ncbi:MAG: hypothetical protein ACXACC_08400 [Promethearchaeota archaeon]|jgi:hypothetical protein
MKRKIITVLAIICGVIIGTVVILIFTSDLDKTTNGDNGDNGGIYPDTLPLGNVPILELPYNTSEYVWAVQGFSISHQGIDLNVNHSVGLVAMHEAYVTNIMTFWNGAGGHWNTNVMFRLNDDWGYEYKLEPWAYNYTHAMHQENNLTISIGDKVLTNQSIGPLLYLDVQCHIDYTLHYQDTPVCQYTYFSAAAKAIFDPLWANYGNDPGSPCQ